MGDEFWKGVKIKDFFCFQKLFNVNSIAHLDYFVLGLSKSEGLVGFHLHTFVKTSDHQHRFSQLSGFLLVFLPLFSIAAEDIASFNGSDVDLPGFGISTGNLHPHLKPEDKFISLHPKLILKTIEGGLAFHPPLDDNFLFVIVKDRLMEKVVISLVLLFGDLHLVSHGAKTVVVVVFF